MQRGGLIVCFISFVLVFLPLLTSCQPVEQCAYMKKWSQATLTYLSIYFSIYSLPLLLGSRLHVAFQSNCEQHYNCVSVAHRNQAKQKMYMEQIFFVSPEQHQRNFPYFFQHLPKSKPYYAVVVEYYILPASIWILLWATCAGWSGSCVRAGAWRAEG